MSTFINNIRWGTWGLVRDSNLFNSANLMIVELSKTDSNLLLLFLIILETSKQAQNKKLF